MLAVDGASLANRGGEQAAAVHLLNLSNGNEISVGGGGGAVDAVEADRLTAGGIAEDLEVEIGVRDARGGPLHGCAVGVGDTSNDVEGVLGSDPVDNIALKIGPAAAVELNALGGDVRHGEDGLLADGGSGHDVVGGQVATVELVVEARVGDASLLDAHLGEVGVLVEASTAGDEVLGLLGGDVVD